MTPNADDPRSLRRLEDERFLRGAGRYADDVPASGHLHALFLRSPHAHAEILDIRTEAAAAMPGVQGVFTAADLLADGIRPIPCSMALPPAVVETWESVSGGLLVEGYGMTETSPISLGNPAAATRRPGRW